MTFFLEVAGLALGFFVLIAGGPACFFLLGQRDIDKRREQADRDFEAYLKDRTPSGHLK